MLTGWSNIDEGKANRANWDIDWKVRPKAERCHDLVSAQPIHLDGATMHMNKKGIIMRCKDTYLQQSTCWGWTMRYWSWLPSIKFIQFTYIGKIYIEIKSKQWWRISPENRGQYFETKQQKSTPHWTTNTM